MTLEKAREKRSMVRLASILVATLLLVVSFMPALSVGAEGVGYSVSPVFPENQITTGLGYYELLMEPGQTQELTVHVTNTTDKEIIVTAEANPGLTNGNGSIEYKPLENRDESMKHPFSELATLNEDTLVIPPNSTVPSVMTITMPEEEIDGMIIGAFVFTKVPEDKGEEQGMSITNVYSYVIGVVLKENDTKIEPDFEFQKVTPDLVDFRTSLVHTIVNPKPIIADDMTMRIEIYKKGGTTPTWTEEKDYLRMAPNTKMAYNMSLEGEKLDPGEYTSKLTLTCEGKEWNLEQDFTIEANKADEINKNAISTLPKEESGIPIWAIIIIAIMVLLVILLIVVVIVLLRRKDENGN